MKYTLNDISRGNFNITIYFVTCLGHVLYAGLYDFAATWNSLMEWKNNFLNDICTYIQEAGDIHLFIKLLGSVVSNCKLCCKESKSLPYILTYIYFSYIVL